MHQVRVQKLVEAGRNAVTNVLSCAPQLCKDNLLKLARNLNLGPTSLLLGKDALSNSPF